MSFGLIECEELGEGLRDASFSVLDCRFDLREPEAGRVCYLKGHIPGALYLGLEEDLSDLSRGGGRHPLPSPDSLNALFTRIGIRASRRVVCYDACGGAMAAARAWWLLRYMGHAGALVLNGGWRRWRKLALPVQAGTEPDPVEGDFRGRPGSMPMAARNALHQAGCLLDAREPDRYRGLFEPIDPCAGHIPGARNLPWKEYLEEDERFCSHDVLRRRLESALGGVPAQHSVFYCGSGVTSCLGILAAVEAGMAAPALYPGSWSEWCRQNEVIESRQDRARQDMSQTREIRRGM